jgi:hypothetical protein
MLRAPLKNMLKQSINLFGSTCRTAWSCTTNTGDLRYERKSENKRPGHPNRRRALQADGGLSAVGSVAPMVDARGVPGIYERHGHCISSERAKQRWYAGH